MRYEGATNLRAPGGRQGLLYLDPINIEITSSSGTNDDTLPTVVKTQHMDSLTLYVQASAILSHLQSGDVSMEAYSTFKIMPGAQLSSNYQHSNRLILIAGDSMELDASASINIKGSVELKANAKMKIYGDVMGAGGVSLNSDNDLSGQGTLTIGNAATVASSNGEVLITATDLDLEGNIDTQGDVKILPSKGQSP